MKKLSVLVGIVVIVFLACSKGGSGYGSNNPPPPPPPSVNCATVAKAFAADVNPIIQSVCATDGTCHGAGSINGPGPLQTYTQIYNARDKIGPAVASGLMPKVGTLTTAQKNTIHCWIAAGAPNN